MRGNEMPTVNRSALRILPLFPVFSLSSLADHLLLLRLRQQMPPEVEFWPHPVVSRRMRQSRRGGISGASSVYSRKFGPSHVFWRCRQQEKVLRWRMRSPSTGRRRRRSTRMRRTILLQTGTGSDNFHSCEAMGQQSVHGHAMSPISRRHEIFRFVWTHTLRLISTDRFRLVNTGDFRSSLTVGCFRNKWLMQVWTVFIVGIAFIEEISNKTWAYRELSEYAILRWIVSLFPFYRKFCVDVWLCI